MAEIIFITSFGLLFYVYIGYYVLVLVMSSIYKRNSVKKEIYPSVTYIITAYNEEKNIAEKLNGVLDLDYPADKLEILVASDGSTDNTDSIVQEFASRGVKSLRVEGRVGKTQTQNKAAENASGEVLIFSDATTRYESQAIKMLIRNYADPNVGGVSGRYLYYDPKNTSIGEGSIMFWNYENTIKLSQTKLNTISGCCGCIYSIRKKCYEPLPADVISDLVEPIMVLQKGYRIVFEPEAIAYEETTEKSMEEFSMRIRVILRGMRGLIYARSMLNPFKHPYISFQLISHKVLRWLVPIIMAVAYITNFMIINQSDLYFYFFILYNLLIIMAIIGYIMEMINIKSKLLSIPLYFFVVNIASVVAMYRLLKGQRAVTWETVRK